MPKVTIDKKTLARTKSRSGMYAQLDKQVLAPTLEDLANQLKPMIEAIVRDAFFNYAKKHGCKPDMVLTEWNRFKNELVKVL